MSDTTVPSDGSVSPVGSATAVGQNPDPAGQPPFTPPTPSNPDPSTTSSKNKLGGWWLLVLIFVALIILATSAWLVFKSFNDRVNTDHAEHMEMSPSVHQIVHVRQKLVIGTDTNFEPMEFLDPQTHDRVGFDIDLGKSIAQELNVPAEFVTVDFDSIFAPQNLGKSNDLTSGKVDLLLDSVTITPERQGYYLFSQPYINVGQVAVTLKTNHTITSKANLANLRLSVAPSTSNEELAKTLTADAKVLRFENPEDQASSVIDGKADAMIVDLTNAKGIVNNHPELKIATDPFTDEFYGAVMTHEKDDLAETINQILNTLKQRGVLESLHQKWFE